MINNAVSIKLYAVIIITILSSCRQERNIGYFSTGEIEYNVPIDADRLYNGDMIRYHKNGVISAVLPYTHGSLTGTSLKYYPSGELAAIENWKDGEPAGRMKYFYNNGQLEATYIKYGKIKIDTLYRYTLSGVLREKTIYSKKGKIIDFDIYNEKGIRDSTYTQPIVIAESDTVIVGDPMVFEVILANRKTNAVFVKFSQNNCKIDSVKGGDGEWKYRAFSQQRGDNIIKGRVYNQLFSGDTLYTWWYELNHQFYVKT